MTRVVEPKRLSELRCFGKFGTQLVAYRVKAHVFDVDAAAQLLFEGSPNSRAWRR